MVRRKKKFSCGHKGFGRICHKCIQANAVIEQKQKLKRDWEVSFDRDSIDLRNLPKNVVLKSRYIIQQLAKEPNYRQFRGKRLRHNRFVISIPINRSYRLLCRDRGQSLSPEAVVSHEDYNVVKPGRI
ncbi:hypothetical protein I4641_05935 [Waterburya agarophytonicola K14]|uniref:Uncharacterized protein n=1 Tax=Waterburya agarophytonicola KI4 TaxID=2874699 RepID=A0A964FGI3_9CYAN|nr:hypothetical protein [Waterburya agarophytonicola]MCC0176518.1 hypothetical protein [Waterburya agarophytonicola KI4]